MRNILAKLGVAGSTSLVLTESLQLDALWNALITLAVSVVSVLAVEGVTWLKNYIIKHTAKVNQKEDDKGGE